MLEWLQPTLTDVIVNSSNESEFFWVDARQICYTDKKGRVLVVLVEFKE
jgi:hypothetical protein